MLRAETIVSLLERFGGYTLSSLLAEDANILQLVTLANLAKGGDESGE